MNETEEEADDGDADADDDDVEEGMMAMAVSDPFGARSGRDHVEGKGRGFEDVNMCRDLRSTCAEARSRYRKADSIVAQGST
mmetsp:Transcript_773/g.1800  ORF Transcript_773/g.1800 Transcript_773/m.1800 type:complete len:82 (-) Transcript_773:25-270(-)